MPTQLFDLDLSPSLPGYPSDTCVSLAKEAAPALQAWPTGQGSFRLNRVAGSSFIHNGSLYRTFFFSPSRGKDLWPVTALYKTVMGSGARDVMPPFSGLSAAQIRNIATAVPALVGFSALFLPPLPLLSSQSRAQHSKPGELGTPQDSGMPVCMCIHKSMIYT